MKIAIDCRMICKSGIGTYLDNILYNLVKSGGDYDYLLIGNVLELSYYIENYKNVRVFECNIPIFSIKELLFFPVGVVNQCDIFYTPNFNIPFGINIPIISTIHDLLFLDCKITSFIGRFIRRQYIYRALKISQAVSTVSQFSKDRIKHHFPFIINDKIEVISNGISRNFKNTQVSKSRIFDFDYFLFVGNIKKHKGLHVLLKAFELYQQINSTIKLVIVGNSANFRTKDQEFLNNLNGSNSNVVFTGKVSNTDLINIISHSCCLIQPSYYEGFGLPPLEALFLGVPVILSDIPVFKEIYSEFDVSFFKVGSEQDLCETMKTLKDCNVDIAMINKVLRGKYDYSVSSSKLQRLFKL